MGGEKYTQCKLLLLVSKDSDVHTQTHIYEDREKERQTETHRENIYEMIEQMKNKNRGLRTTWLTRWSALDVGT